MKVLFFIPTLLGGGAEKVLTEVVKNIDRNKYNITVLTLYNLGKYIDEVDKFVTYKFIFDMRNCSNISRRIKYKLVSFFDRIPSRVLWA